MSHASAARSVRLLPLLSLPLAGLLAPQADAQSTGLLPGRESIWPAPTAEDWARPCLIQWQRSFEDAIAVAKETRKPILVCVNMDGEIASEHYAGIRYRDPDTAKLYEPYVCVIASVYRHTPRDYDEQGNRIPCPRFGTVTCDEHIWIEPGLYDKFFEGERVAPRHIMIELDGYETYDVYYALDTQSVFRHIEQGITEREIETVDIARDDRPAEERVGYRHVEDQEAAERAYREGDEGTRRVLLERAIAAGDAAPMDMLRLAIYGFDVEMSQLAREALAQASSPAATNLINEALRVPMDPAERDALIAALERIGEQSPKARTLAVVHRGLAGQSGDVDVSEWSAALDGVESAERQDWSVLETQLSYREAALATRAEDAQAQLELAEATLAMAVDPATARMLSADRSTLSQYQALVFEDARRAALEAERLGAGGWRVDAVLGLAAYYLGESEEAYRRAERAAAGVPAGDASWNAMAVLALFAEGRREAILAAVRDKGEWPAEWLTDVHDAYSVVARHPLGNDRQVAAHHDFLRRMGAEGQASRALDQGLERFPDSWELHGRLRYRILRERGVAGLEPAYAERLADPALANDRVARANLEWYAGLASLVAAEFHRRASADDEALAAYDRGIEHYERAIEARPETRDTADHYVAMAIAGRARLALEAQSYEAALGELLASFERRPDAAATLDGLGISPVATAQMLRARLDEAQRPELVARLDAALDALHPTMLLPAAFEAPNEGPRTQGTRPSGGRAGQRGG